jgi:hypothetical protein
LAIKFLPSNLNVGDVEVGVDDNDEDVHDGSEIVLDCFRTFLLLAVASAVLIIIWSHGE